MTKIPVYQVSIPEYKLKKFNNTSQKVNYAGTPWFDFKIPKVYLDNKPDFEKIGLKADKCLKRHFTGKKIALRVLSSDEHKGKSIDDMVKIIKKLGYDRYNPKRQGDRYDNIDNLHIDFFALDFQVREDGTYFKDILEPFYFWPISENRKPIRIDIAIVYDLNKLKMVPHRYKGREKELKKDGFVFKDQKNKSDAVLGIIKIL